MTSLLIDGKNVAELVKVARARWKDENEGFNSAKHQGYHLGHNFGHGHKNLSFNLYLLNMLAFGVHRLVELGSDLYKECRAIYGAREIIWQKIRNYMDILRFQSWEEIWLVLIHGCRGQDP